MHEKLTRRRCEARVGDFMRLPLKVVRNAEDRNYMKTTQQQD